MQALGSLAALQAGTPPSSLSAIPENALKEYAKHVVREDVGVAAGEPTMTPAAAAAGAEHTFVGRVPSQRARRTKSFMATLFGR